MDQTVKTERFHILDLESDGTNNVDEDSRLIVSGAEKSKRALGRVWSGFVKLDNSVKGLDTTCFFNHSTNVSDVHPGNREVSALKIVVQDQARIKEERFDSGKPRKTKCKKPPKPPRPPKGPLLDAADQKMVQQISELAMMKRARIERMKALKKMKDNKPLSSNGSICAMIITIMFCLVIFLQGVFSQTSTTVKFQGSPVPAMASTPGFISIQFNTNNSIGMSSSVSSASPGNVMLGLSADIRCE